MKCNSNDQSAKITFGYFFCVFAIWAGFTVLMLMLSGCASKPKEARDWKVETVRLKPKDMKMMIAKTGGSKSETIVALHGLGDVPEYPYRSRYGSESLVQKINAMESSHVIDLGFDGDLAWMLRPEGNGYQSVNEYVKHLKSQQAKFPQKLIGVGISMGGHNLITVALTNPELFSRVVLLNPMLLKPDQWHKFEVKDYDNPNAMPGEHFSQEEWQRYSPFALLKKVPFPIWVTACREDQFGLFEPTEEWVRRAREIGNDVTFVAVSNCKHTEPNVEF